MKDQQSYSHGLLFSVEPEDIATLHLIDEKGHSEFSWPTDQSRTEGSSIVRLAIQFLKSNRTGS